MAPLLCLLIWAAPGTADPPGDPTVPSGAVGDGGGPRFALGLYPGIAGAVGAPTAFSVRANGYLSFTIRERMSVFVGYGQEWSSRADSELYTIGWGGVRRLPGTRSQKGFHGKFLRYRRWDHHRHGVHHGLSLGTESGVGPFGLELEAGAARSAANHWMLVAQVSLKLALPVLVPLGG